MSANLTLSATSGQSVTVTCLDSVFMAGDVTRVIRSGAGRATIKVVNAANNVTVSIVDSFADAGPIEGSNWYLQGSGEASFDANKSKVGETVEVTSNLAIFRSNDVSKWIVMLGGTIVINQVVSSTVINGTIKTTLKDASDNDPDATTAWTIQKSAWTPAAGFPACGTFYGERMYLARDQTIWGSKTGDWENFSPGSSDDDAITRTISDNEVNEIIAMTGLNALQIFTRGGEYSAAALGEKPLSPNNWNVVPRSSRGSKQHTPVRIGGVIVFIQSGSRKLREYAYSFESDGFKSPDLLLLADHLTEESGLKKIGYAQEPDSIVYALRDDGVLLALVYQREEQVLGWSRIITDGVITSFDIIPRSGIGKDQMWISVKRTINGIEQTFIEYSEDNAASLESTREWPEMYLDASVIRQPTGNNITNLGHLEGQTVSVVGDGKIYPNQVVTANSIPRGTPTAEIYEIGLPFSSRLVTLEPVIPNQFGGAMMPRGWVWAAISFRRSLGITVQGEEIQFRETTDDLTAQIPLKRGKQSIRDFSYDARGRIIIESNEPLPCEILSILGKLRVGDEPENLLEVEDDDE